MAEQKKPFFKGTRLRMKKLAKSIPYAALGTATIELPPVGLLAMLLLEVEGNFTCQAGLTVKDKGIWSLIKNIKVETNLGQAEVYNVSGYGTMVQSHWLANGFRAQGLSNVALGQFPDPSTFLQPINIGANPIKFMLPVPISANLHKDAEIGLINLQADTMSCNLTIDFGQGSDVYGSNAANDFVGNVYVTYLYWELPDESMFQMPPPVAVRRFEKAQTITGKGEQTYKVERMGSLLNIAQYAELDSVLVQNLEKVILKMVDSDSIIDESFAANRFLSQIRLGQPLPIGTAFLDFWGQDGIVSAGGLRDAYNTTNVALMELKTSIPDALVLDINKTNKLKTIRTTLQSYTVGG